jgi:hypothetical protein
MEAAVRPGNRPAPGLAVRGELTPATFELILTVLLVRQRSLQSDVAHNKRLLGAGHPAVGERIEELRQVAAAVLEIENFGTPLSRVPPPVLHPVMADALRPFAPKGSRL